MNTITKTLTALSAFALIASSANAAIIAGQSIGMDFGPTPETNNFNDFPGRITINSMVLLSDGTTPSGVTGRLGGDDQNFYNNDPNNSLDGLSSDYNASNVTDLVGRDGDIRIFLSNLDDSLTYDIEVVLGGSAGAAFNGAGIDAEYTTGDVTSLYSPATNVATPRIATFTGLSTRGDGTITLKPFAGSGSGRRSGVSALIITAVPEPGSLALLASALLGLLCLRRRK